MNDIKIKAVNKKSGTELSKNIIQFRNGFVNIPDNGEENKSLAMSVMSELLQFGYMLTPEAIENIAASSAENIKSFYNEVISYLKVMTGSNRNYKPFWPGFPQQVMEKSEFELWIHQIVHYMSNGAYSPNEWTKERPTAFEQPKYHKIVAGDETKFENIFTSLVSVNNSLTPDDLEIVKFLILNNYKLRFPDKIPFKENLCTLFSMGIDLEVKLTVTDILRICTGLSGGDVSLPPIPPQKIQLNRWSSRKEDNPARELFKFKKFSRSERRKIMELFERTNCDATEAVIKDQRFIRLAEILHPGEYKTKFPKAFAMFNAIRNEKVQSWNGKVNSAFRKSVESGLAVLSERPGEFMRRLDALVRTYSHKEELILSTLSTVASKVSNKVLFEAYTHFEGRKKDNFNRTIMVKGARRRTKLPDLYALNSTTVDAIQNTINKALIGKFSTMEKLGKVYVDEELKKIPLPTNMRSASSSLRPIIRGQRSPIGNQNAKVIRAFVHWFDEHGNQDIDLHGILMGIGKVASIGWNSGHNKSYGTFSGDVRHRQGACAEYVDIIVEEALKDGFKYAVLTANNYNGGSFESVTDCTVGYMERENAEVNQMFKPDSIANCMRLTNQSSNTLMSVIDLETRESIHLDIDQNGVVASNDINQLLESIKPYCELPKFSVYDLALLHVDGRGGELVNTCEEADQAFTFEEMSASYVEIMKLMGV